MGVRLAGALLMLGGIVACAPADDAGSVTDGEADAPAAATEEIAGVATEVSTVCQPQEMALEDRASPYDSVAIAVGGEEGKLCYGRPSMRNREIFGGLVPYDTLWRTGANEPTTVHLPFAAEIAGLRVDPGSYSIYTVPGRESWDVIVNQATSQWGIETQYSEDVRAQEVGRAAVPTEPIGETVEVFTIRTEETGPESVNLLLEWENTRVRIPIEKV